MADQDIKGVMSHNIPHSLKRLKKNAERTENVPIAFCDATRTAQDSDISSELFSAWIKLFDIWT